MNVPIRNRARARALSVSIMKGHSHASIAIDRVQAAMAMDQTCAWNVLKDMNYVMACVQVRDLRYITLLASSSRIIFTASQQLTSRRNPLCRLVRFESFYHSIFCPCLLISYSNDLIIVATSSSFSIAIFLSLFLLLSFFLFLYFPPSRLDK